MRLLAALAPALLLLGCSFDTSGVPSDVARDGGGLLDGPIGVDRDGGPADAGAPDATPEPCLDRDGDQFQSVGIPGSSCGDKLDCDDSDDLAYPGQPEFFDTPRTSGGFDYDCDGEETPIDTRTGGGCGWDWWDCVGTGWTAGVPACGEPAPYHVCRDEGGCREVSSGTIKMKCQ